MTLQVDLVAPDRILYSGEADMVICRTPDGEIAFLTGHVPFLGALGIGVVRVHQAEGDVVKAAVHGGFVEVKDDQVVILSDVAELADQIDAERARRAKEDAEAKLQREDDAEAEARLRRATARLQLADEQGG